MPGEPGNPHTPYRVRRPRFSQKPWGHIPVLPLSNWISTRQLSFSPFGIKCSAKAALSLPAPRPYPSSFSLQKCGSLQYSQLSQLVGKYWSSVSSPVQWEEQHSRVCLTKLKIHEILQPKLSAMHAPTKCGSVALFCPEVVLPQSFWFQGSSEIETTWAGMEWMIPGWLAQWFVFLDH